MLETPTGQSAAKLRRNMEWKYFHGYLISDNGDVIDSATGKLITKSITSAGYEIVHIYIEGYRKTVGVHVLVAGCFIGWPGGTMEVDHINNIRNDNRLENLQWLTKSENNQKVWDSGNKDNTGQNNGRCKTDPCDVHVICLLLEEGCKTSSIRDITGFDYHSVIRPIARGSTWKHISSQYSF